MFNKFKQTFKENQFFLQLLVLLTSAIILAVVFTVFIFISITEKNVLDNYMKTHTLVIDEIASNYSDTYEEAINLITTLSNKNTIENYLTTKSDSGLESMNISYNMTRTMNEIDANIKSSQANMFFFSDERVYFAFGDQRIHNNFDFNHKQEFRNTISTEIQYHIVESGFTTLTQNNPQILMHRNLFDNNHEYYGKIVLSFSIDDIDYVYERLLDTKNELIYFVDNNNTVIHSNTDQVLNNVLLEGDSYLMTEANLNIPNLKMLSFVNRSSLINEVYRINSLIISILLLILSISAILYFIVRNITTPISNLSRNMRQNRVEKINPEVIGGTFEIRTLTQSYNQMVDDVDKYITDIVDLKEMKLQSDLTALLRQISPHFIYNTLASIRFLIMSNQNDIAAESLEDFIVLLQALTHFDEGLITLSDEHTILTHYIRLQKLRFGPDIQAIINLPDSLKDFKVPQLILQPIVENSLFHAFGSNGGLININFNEHDDILVIEIMDNGKGIDERKLAQIETQMRTSSPTTHIGIANVHQRIQLQFGEDYGLSIFSELNRGTIVTLRIPKTI